MHTFLTAASVFGMTMMGCVMAIRGRVETLTSLRFHLYSLPELAESSAHHEDDEPAA